MLKRKLTSEEISDICSVIISNNKIDKDIAEALTYNIVSNIKKQLVKVDVYPGIIPLLKEQIKHSYDSSFLHPGENVGCIAASSIGEQNTQASLNSFHSAGIGKVALTSGVPRLKELLNVSKEVKTPSCLIYLKPEIGDLKNLYFIKEICDKEFTYYNIKSLLKEIKIEYRPPATDFENKYHNFFKTFYDDTFIQYDWRIRLTLSLEHIFRIKKSLSYIAGCIKLSLSGNSKNCINESISVVFYPDTTGIIDIWVSNNIDNPINIIKKKQSKNTDDLQSGFVFFINDENKVYFFIKDVLIPLIYECPVSGLFGIEECYFTEEKNGEWSITTKGCNYREIVNHPLVIPYKCKSNNIWDIYDVFGIDAAKNFLEEEFFINLPNLNKRHLDLLTASMTTNGKITSVSRYGIDRKQVGPLAKICFEQAFDNVIQAAIAGEKDHLIGASASVCVGKQIRTGTGIVHLYTKEDKNSDIFLSNKEQTLLSNYSKNQSGKASDIMKILLDPWGPARLSAKNKQSPEQVYNEDEDFETMY
jgi:DNA-directed RNA polymerase II subunit RPB1